MFKKQEYVFACRTHNGKYRDMFRCETADEAISNFRRDFNLDEDLYEEIFVEKICNAYNP